jgi:hypothetical protein
MKLNYKIIFTINLLHDYYADGKSRDFTIAASPETEELLRSMGMLARSTDHGLVIMAREGDTPGTCFIPIKKNANLCFYMKLKPGQFVNYTNIEWNPVSGQRFYFSNRTNNKRGTILNLSKPVAAYADTVTYAPGALAKDPLSNDIYEAAKGSSNADKHALTPANAFWNKLGDIQYTTAEGDLLDVCGAQYFFSLTASSFSIEIFGLNRTTGAFDVPMAPLQTQRFDDPVDGVPIDMTGLDKGRYAVTVNGVTKFVYCDAALKSNEICGVIEIFCDLDGANDYAFATEAAPVPPATQPVFTIKRCDYTIRFRNRRTVWKYIVKTANVTAIQDENLDAAKRYTFNKTGLEFVSDKPIPFTETPIKLFKPQFAAGPSDPSPLPNAAGDMLKKTKLNLADNYEYYCAEIYLNF